jgi:hypothetical protein
MPGHQELRVEPTALVRLANCVLDATVTVGKSMASVRPRVAVPAAAFGEVDSGRRVYESYLNVTRDFERLADVFMSVYEVDADKLYQVAFAYQEMIEEASRKISKISSSGPTPNGASD